MLFGSSFDNVYGTVRSYRSGSSWSGSGSGTTKRPTSSTSSKHVGSFEDTPTDKSSKPSFNFTKKEVYSPSRCVKLNTNEFNGYVCNPSSLK